MTATAAIAIARGFHRTRRGALAVDGRLPPRETVAGLEVGRDAVAYPFSALRTARVVNDRVGDLPVVIVHQPSSDTTTAFDARVNGKALKFQAANDDARTASRRCTGPFGPSP
jgi:hypothetical protein